VTDEDSPASFRECFLAALGEPAATTLAALPSDSVEELLREHLARAREAWPDFELAPAAFLAHLAERVAAPSELVALRDLRASDLYVACACARGDERAIVAFERTYFGEVDAAAARLRAGATIADEVKQTLRRALFVAEPGRAPAIRDYAGRGDLRGWVRISALREAQRLLKRARREVALADDDLLSALSPAEDLELAYLRQRYQAAFAAAFRDALAATSPEDRSLIRYQLVDGLTIDELAKLYRVHRATCARWLAAARDGILTRTRDTLRAAIGISTEELDTVIRLMHSRLDVSIERMLR
jgi:RNA polymerase sigma-70 factor (ECF subfamily)